MPWLINCTRISPRGSLSGRDPRRGRRDTLSPEISFGTEDLSPREDQRSPEPTKQAASGVIVAFPDRRIAHEVTIAEG